MPAFETDCPPSPHSPATLLPDPVRRCIQATRFAASPGTTGCSNSSSNRDSSRGNRILRASQMYAAGLLALGLAGCANMADVPPGTSIGDVYQNFGQPNTVCARADGGQRMVWSQQPMGQYAWGTNVSPQGQIDQIYPVLTNENFAKLSTGRWTPDDLLCEFGRPAFIDEVGTPSVRQVVWNYRYRESSAWNSLMYVYMGPNGDAVTRFHPGPDPMYEPRDGAFW